MNPDWKDAPEWAQFLATDASGVSYWHETRPVWDVEYGEWSSDGDVRQALTPEMSLERRP